MNAHVTDIAADSAVDPAFVYVIYIQAPAQKIWDALTDPAMQRRFWFGQHTESDWQAGSPVAHKSPDGSVNFSGQVLESEAPHRLVFTFHNGEKYPVMHAEGPTRASYLIEDAGSESGRPMTRLTVTHDGFSKLDSRSRKGVSGGWPAILSSLKTLLETGEELPLKL